MRSNSDESQGVVSSALATGIETALNLDEMDEDDVIPLLGTLANQGRRRLSLSKGKGRGGFR